MQSPVRKTQDCWSQWKGVSPPREANFRAEGNNEYALLSRDQDLVEMTVGNQSTQILRAASVSQSVMQLTAGQFDIVYLLAE